MQRLAWIAVAGAAGTLARYSLSGLVQRFNTTTFPWGTVAVNLVGSFLFGLAWSLGEDSLRLSPEIRTIILAGFMGAFTTFSTFMFDTGDLLQDGAWGLALGNIMFQSMLGLACMFAGLAMGRGV